MFWAFGRGADEWAMGREGGREEGTPILARSSSGAMSLNCCAHVVCCFA